jgi:radical SAM/Cys-rich protein
MKNGSRLQLDILASQDAPNFDDQLERDGCSPLVAGRLTTLQVNLGRKCNQVCSHCHVDAGPHRAEEMSRETAELIVGVLERQRFQTLDITGGAPEINNVFRYLAERGAALCERVINRSNLTIFFEPGHEDLPEFLAGHGIEVTASLPCYDSANVDRQRGRGVFDKSIDGLLRLNALGYGQPDSDLVLNLVFNPLGPALPPDQRQLEARYHTELHERFGIVFNQLFTITNMPINRFRHDLERRGELLPYMQQLEQAFNPSTVESVMCRSLVSVGWDGLIYDCDFNQMLDMPVDERLPRHIRDFDRQRLEGRRIRTAAHCFACTAGSGSSCEGAVAG